MSTCHAEADCLGRGFPSPAQWKRETRTTWTLAVLLAIALAVRSTAAEPKHVSQATATVAPELQAELGKSYASQGPLGTVCRRLYLPYPQPNTSAVLSCGYTGARGLRRYEQLTYQVFDDVYQDPERRYSDDNGKTWTPWESDSAHDIVASKDLCWQWNPTGIVARQFDPESGLLVSAASLACFQGGDPRQVGLKTVRYFTFYATSADDGRTWSAWKQLQYEPGPPYSESVRDTEEFLAKNQCLFYHVILAPQSGGLVLPVGHLAHLSNEQGQPYDYDCPRCLRGKWNPATHDYDWTASEPIAASPKLTGYLEEPWMAELAGGRLLIDMRGTNRGSTGHQAQTDASGRHWYALSLDHGRTWSEVRDWRYESGETFYSPATMAKILRHSQTGRLYWFGNISRVPPSGNSPRYPLVIAEIDETKPAILKESVTAIDDYDASRHTPAVQFSNFYVFENRQTQQFELYLSPYGQYDNVYQASVYQYLITLR